MSKSTPKAPDYAAAAEAQGQSSRENIEQQTWANRPTQNTPFGQQTWESTPTWDPVTGQYLNRWTQNTTLNPESQRALDAQLDLTTGRSELGAGMMDRARNEFGQEVDWSRFQQGGQAVQAPGQVNAGPITGAEALPQNQYSPEQIQRSVETEGPELDPAQRYYSQAGDAIYNQWADRALPQQERDTDRLRTQLYNMGFKEGDAGYDVELEKLRQAQGDAQRQAQYQATIGAGTEAQRMLGMDAATRAQLFGENVQQGQFGNQASGQALAQQLALGGQQFQEALAGANLGNQAQQQRYGQQAQQQQQQFGNQLTASQYQNQLRQQQIAEEMQRRGWSLNEINALISGQQVGMPQMPSFNPAQAAQPTQYLGAAQAQGQADLDAYNAQQGGLSGMLGGLGGLGMAAGMMGFNPFGGG